MGSGMDFARALVVATIIVGGMLWLMTKALSPPKSDETPGSPPPQENVISKGGRESPTVEAASPGDRLKPDDVRRMREACVAEVKAGGKPKRDPNSACSQYERGVAAVGDTSINVVQNSDTAPSNPEREDQAGRSPDKRVRPSLVPSECTHVPYGSIRYRRCRANEKERLMDFCRNARQRADEIVDSMRQERRARAEATCRVAELYQIVK